jgi:hypothetical protein
MVGSLHPSEKKTKIKIHDVFCFMDARKLMVASLHLSGKEKKKKRKRQLSVAPCICPGEKKTQEKVIILIVF